MDRPGGFASDMAPSIIRTRARMPSNYAPMPTPDLHYSSMNLPSDANPSFGHPMTASLELHRYPTPPDAYMATRNTLTTPPMECFPLPQPDGSRYLPQPPESNYYQPPMDGALAPTESSTESLQISPLEAPYTVTRFGPGKQRQPKGRLTDCPFSKARADNPNVPLCKNVQKSRHAVI
jgi:hypothetical protein